jgi:tetrahydromethanopterin S-methyltransferase subunit B
MKKILIPLLGLFIVSCTPKISVIPKAPIVSESALKDLKRTQSGIDDSLDDNKKIKEKLKTQEKTIYSQKMEIEEALVQAEKIKEKVKKLEQVTNEDTYMLVEQLKKVHTRNLFLESETKDLVKTNENQLKILEDTKKDAQKTFEKLVKAESELGELRNQNAYLVGNLKKRNDEVLKLSGKLATASVYKNWVIGVVILIIILIIAYIILIVASKSVNPFA